MTTTTKFVYISHDYRKGWDNWIKGNVRRDQYFVVRLQVALAELTQVSSE